jgi:hypothetical protein
MACLFLLKAVGFPQLSSNNTSFTDISGHWAYDSIVWAYEENILNGISVTEFAPNIPMNRAMLLTSLWRFGGSPKRGTVFFSDVNQNEWYTDAVAWASDIGLVNGYGEGVLGINEAITREQVMLILYSYAQQRGIDTNQVADISKYEDATSVSYYAVDAVKWGVANNLLRGYASTTLNPNGNATRAEIATLLRRFFHYCMAGMLNPIRINQTIQNS